MDSVVDVDIEDSVAVQEPTEDQIPPRSEDSDLSRRVKVEVTAPEPEKKEEPAAEPKVHNAEGKLPPSERVDETSPPEQRVGNAPKPNGSKGKRQLTLPGGKT